MDIFLNVLKCIWNIIINYIAPLGDLCIVVITLVIFVFTYVIKKVSILSLGESHSIWDGYSLSVALKNCTLADICVKKVSLIFDEEFEIKVNEYETPIIIGALKTMSFESEKMSQEPFENGFTMHGHKIKAKIILSDSKIIYAKIKTTKKRKLQKEKIYDQPLYINYKDGDRVITPQMKYKVVIYKNDTFVTDIIILKSGLMNQPIAGYNVIPPESLKSKNNVKAALETMLKSKDFTVVVLDYSIESFQ